MMESWRLFGLNLTKKGDSHTPTKCLVHYSEVSIVQFDTF